MGLTLVHSPSSFIDISRREIFVRSEVPQEETSSSILFSSVVASVDRILPQIQVPLEGLH
jgi:hypothetical protein